MEKDKTWDQWLKLAQEGSEEAKDQCVRMHTGLVWSLVHRFHYSKVDQQDLFQIGCVGLMKAILNYDFSYQVMFSTYAVPMILGEIKKYFREEGSMRVSRSIKERYLEALKCRDKLFQKLEKEPTYQEIAQAMNASLEDVILAFEANQFLASMDEPIYQKDGSSIRLEDKVEGKREDPVLKMALRQEVSRLNQREQYLLYLRYEQEMNQTEIAKKMQMTQVQVSRMEKKILLKLKEKING